MAKAREETKKLFQQLLGLGESWGVNRAYFEMEQHTFVICVEETAKPWSLQSPMN